MGDTVPMPTPTDDRALRPTERYSTAIPRRAWYPACRSSDLTRKPRAIEFLGMPIALFRGKSGVVGAVVDRCAHRNAPLSLGRVNGDSLECGYHGWCFDPSGACTDVPGLVAESDSPSRRVPAFSVVEQDDFVWIWGEPGGQPTGRPFALPQLGASMGETVFVRDLESTMHAALEQALDVPHTAFLHGGIFRKGARHDLTAIRRELPDGVEVEYRGEPLGFAGISIGGDAEFEHWDRFFLPCVAQIEYKVGDWLRITNNILHLPLDEFRTRAWYVLRYSTPVPRGLAGPIIKARGQKILQQDVDMLVAQTATIRRFGGERFTSTDLDLLGNAIARMLRQAVRAEHDGGGAVDAESDDVVETIEQTVTIRV